MLQTEHELHKQERVVRSREEKQAEEERQYRFRDAVIKTIDGLRKTAREKAFSALLQGLALEVPPDLVFTYSPDGYPAPVNSLYRYASLQETLPPRSQRSQIRRRGAQMPSVDRLAGYGGILGAQSGQQARPFV